MNIYIGNIRFLACIISLIVTNIPIVLYSSPQKPTSTVQKPTTAPKTSSSSTPASKTPAPKTPVLKTAEKPIQSVSPKESAAVTAVEKENGSITDAELSEKSADDTDHDVTMPPSLLNKFTNKLQNLGSKASSALDVSNKTFPGIGKCDVELASNPYQKGARVTLRFSKIGKGAGQVIDIPTSTLTMAEGKISGRLTKNETVRIFGHDAKIRVRNLELGEGGSFLGKIIFEVVFIDPIKAKLPTGGDLVIDRAYLTAKTTGEYPLILTARVNFLGQPVRVMLLYSPGYKLSAAIRVFKLPLKSLVRSIANTPLKNLMISRGRILVDLWVPSGDAEFSFLDDDPARELRIEADIEKIPELPLDEEMEDVDSSTIDSEMATELTDNLNEDVKSDTTVTSFPADTSSDELVSTPTSSQAGALDAIPDKTESSQDEGPQLPTQLEDIGTTETTDTPPEEMIPEEATQAEIDKPDLVHPGDVEISEQDVNDALPDSAAMEPDATDAEDVLPEEEACDYANDPCCREKDQEVATTYSLQATLSRKSLYLSIGMQDIKIPKLGVLGNAQITVMLDKEKTARELSNTPAALAQKRAEILIEAGCLPIKIGTIENVSITLNMSRSEKERSEEDVYSVKKGRVNVLGTIRIKFPHLGKLPFLVNATLSKSGLLFAGTLDLCQTWTTPAQSKTGYQEQRVCTKNSLSYGGLALENVKIMYGYPSMHAAEQRARTKLRRKKANLKQQHVQQILARKQLATAVKNNDTGDLDEELISLAHDVLPDPNNIQLEKRQKTLSLISTVNLWGVRLISTLSLVPDPVNPAKRTLAFSAKGVLKNFQPFKYVPGAKNIKELRAITFDELSAEVTFNIKDKKPRPSFKLMGAASLFGVVIRSNLKWVVSKKGEPGVFIYTTPQTQQSLSDVIPLLQGSFFKNITCCNTSFALSSVSNIDTSYFTEEEMIDLYPYNLDTIRKGITLVANVPFTGTLDKVGKFLGINRPPTKAEEEAEAERQKNFPDEPPNLCSGYTRMFRILGNLNLSKPALSEFRIGITSQRLRQFSSSSSYSTRYYGSALDTKFSDTRLNVAPTSQIPDYFYTMSHGATRPPTKEAPPRDEQLVELDAVEIFFLGDTVNPSLGVAAGIILRPTKTDLLRLKGSFEFSATTASIGAQMMGTWHDAFSLKGWDLSDVSIVLGILYGSPIPTRLGGSADLKVKTDLHVGFKFMADAKLTDMGFEGTSNKMFTMLDVSVLFLRAVGVNIPTNLFSFPMPLELSNMYIKYAPRDMRIADQILEAGFALKSDFNLLGAKGKIDMRVNATGLKAYGTMEKVNWINLLEVTSADGKGDPTIDVELSFDRQNFLITGRIAVAKLIEKEAYMEVLSNGFKFRFTDAIGKTVYHGKPLLMTEVSGETSGTLTDPQFMITFDFQQNFQGFIKEQASSALQSAEKAIADGLNKAQGEINKIHKVSEDAHKKIQDAQDQVARAHAELDGIKKAKQQVNQKIQDAKDAVGKIKQEIQELDQWYNRLPAA